MIELGWRGDKVEVRSVGFGVRRLGFGIYRYFYFIWGLRVFIVREFFRVVIIWIFVGFRECIGKIMDIFEFLGRKKEERC